MKINAKIDTVLPIILSLALPALRLFAGKGYGGSIPLIVEWLLLSVMLFVLWYFLWLLWDKPFSRKHRWYTVSYALIVIILLGFNQTQVVENISSFQYAFMFRLAASAFMFLAIQYAIKSQQNISNLLLEKEQLQTEHYKTQLQSLRTKIDPHFLFNTLNTLRVMVRNQHIGTEKFVMSLSDFYRQTLQFNENPTICLAKELEVLEAYLFLMKSRNQVGLHIEIVVDEKLHQRFIPTLSLQIAIENCFKHNTMTAVKPLHITITTAEDSFISIRNNIQPKLTPTQSSGYGLENIRQRYKLLGVENGIEIEQTTNFFEVKLKLI